MRLARKSWFVFTGITAAICLTVATAAAAAATEAAGITAIYTQ